VEAGKSCRLDTKRKILQALGLRISDKEGVFGERSIDDLLEHRVSSGPASGPQ
jgi:hypothetical protein